MDNLFISRAFNDDIQGIQARSPIFKRVLFTLGMRDKIDQFVSD